MPLISSSIPNLINGVSQQPAALRLASQAEAVVNCMSSPVEGLKKRPPMYHIGKLFNGSAGTNSPFTTIVDRDGSIQYLVLIRDQSIRVFGLDGTEKTVTTPDGVGYLDIAGDPCSQFRVASVADYTFIVNREKTVLMDTVNKSPNWGTKSMVFIRSAEYDTTYSVKVNATEVSFKTEPVGGRQIAGSYSQSGTTTVTVTANGHGLSTGNLVRISFSSGAGVAGSYTITVVNANSFTYTAATAATTSGNCTAVYDPTPSSVDIASKLTASLTTALGAGWTITNTDYIVRITKNDGGNYTLTSSDTKTGKATVPVKGTIDTLSDLPTIAEHGFTVKVQGSKSTSFDDYYVKFEANAGSGFGPGVWRETVAPNVNYQFDAATMPHVLIRNNDGTFTFQKFSWSARVAGDAITAPEPSFVGSRITNVNLFKNRLVFLADENVILSAADSYDRFWPETVQTVVDSDPVDLSTGGAQINFLTSSLAFANTLLLFSRHGQFRLESGTSVGSSLTPKTATISPMTSFEMDGDIDPVAVGRTVYFSIPKGAYAGLREFFLPDASGPVPLSEEVTSSIPRYIPGNLNTLTATVSEEAIVMISKDQPRKVYLYKFFFQDDTKLQSSWSYWEVGGEKRVLSADFVDADLYAVVQYLDGVYLERVSLRPEVVDDGTTVELLVDRKVSEASCSVSVTSPSGLDPQTTITLPYQINPGSTMVVVGRQQEAWLAMEDDSIITMENGDLLLLATGSSLGQVLYPMSQGSNTLTVRGDLGSAMFWAGELYEMLYQFSTPYLKEQPPGGGMAVAGGPRMQLRTWTMLFDKSSAFEIRVTPRGRDTNTYSYNGIPLGDGAQLEQLPLVTGKFRVPVMTQNTDAKVELFSDSPLPCRFQSAEWEGWYHTRAQRL